MKKFVRQPKTDFVKVNRIIVKIGISLTLSYLALTGYLILGRIVIGV